MATLIEGLTKGRIVRYQYNENTELAALICKVWDPTVGSGCSNLSVFLETGEVYPVTSIKHDKDCKVGTWHWPHERKPAEPVTKADEHVDVDEPEDPVEDDENSDDPDEDPKETLPKVPKIDEGIDGFY